MSLIDAEELVVDGLSHSEDLGLLVLVPALPLTLLNELLHLVLLLERLCQTVELSPESLDAVVVRDLLFNCLKLLIRCLVLRHEGLVLICLFTELCTQIAFGAGDVLDRRGLVDGGVECRERVAFLLHLGLQGLQLLQNALFLITEALQLARALLQLLLDTRAAASRATGLWELLKKRDALALQGGDLRGELDLEARPLVDDALGLEDVDNHVLLLTRDRSELVGLVVAQYLLAVLQPALEDFLLVHELLAGL